MLAPCTESIGQAFLFSSLSLTDQKGGSEVWIILRGRRQGEVQFFLVIEFGPLELHPLLPSLEDVSIGLVEAPSVHLLVVWVETLTQVVVPTGIAVLFFLFGDPC